MAPSCLSGDGRAARAGAAPVLKQGERCLRPLLLDIQLHIDNIAHAKASNKDHDRWKLRTLRRGLCGSEPVRAGRAIATDLQKQSACRTDGPLTSCNAAKQASLRRPQCTWSQHSPVLPARADMAHGPSHAIGARASAVFSLIREGRRWSRRLNWEEEEGSVWYSGGRPECANCFGPHRPFLLLLLLLFFLLPPSASNPPSAFTIRVRPISPSIAKTSRAPIVALIDRPEPRTRAPVIGSRCHRTHLFAPLEHAR